MLCRKETLILFVCFGLLKPQWITCRCRYCQKASARSGGIIVSHTALSSLNNPDIHTVLGNNQVGEEHTNTEAKLSSCHTWSLELAETGLKFEAFCEKLLSLVCHDMENQFQYLCLIEIPTLTLTKSVFSHLSWINGDIWFDKSKDFLFETIWTTHGCHAFFLWDRCKRTDPPPGIDRPRKKGAPDALEPGHPKRIGLVLAESPSDSKKFGGHHNVSSPEWGLTSRRNKNKCVRGGQFKA